MNPSAALWPETGYVAMALVLSTAIGLEREARRKSAGLRTQALVGMGACLFMIISKEGFFDVLVPGRVVVDPSRVAAQIVTGIGFVGAGVIFVHRGSVKGLTTAAAIWVSAAVGAACGAGLLALAAVVTAAYFAVAYLYPRLLALLPRWRSHRAHLELVYVEGRGALRRALEEASQLDFEIERLAVRRSEATMTGSSRVPSTPAASDLGSAGAEQAKSQPIRVLLQVEGHRPVPELAAVLASIEGVVSVESLDDPAE